MGMPRRMTVDAKREMRLLYLVRTSFETFFCQAVNSFLLRQDDVMGREAVRSRCVSHERLEDCEGVSIAVVVSDDVDEIIGVEDVLNELARFGSFVVDPSPEIAQLESFVLFTQSVD